MNPDDTASPRLAQAEPSAYTSAPDRFGARRALVAGGLAGLLCALLPRPAAAVLPRLEVYKLAGCSCCEAWMEHVRAAGFRARAQTVRDLQAVKARARVPGDLESCHTAFVGGYVVEGHVPAAAIERLILERPSVVGIAVPGMPEGSPGMEGPNPVAYEVIAWRADGRRAVFERVAPSRSG